MHLSHVIFRSVLVKFVFDKGPVINNGEGEGDGVGGQVKVCTYKKVREWAEQV